jgi:hypothetical protein
MLRRTLGTASLCVITAFIPLCAVQAGLMSSPVKFRVNELGAATFSLPIQVPPGTAGLEPKVAITYNSREGSGLVGLGGGLSATSVITRCPSTLSQDGRQGSLNYDGDDRFCLDGQRLFAVTGAYGATGTEYRTEMSNFSKIVSYASTIACRPSGSTTWICEAINPGYFKVWTKSGQIMEYGNTADSNIKVTGAQGKVVGRAWSMNRVQDIKGNYQTITYVNDIANGDFDPSRIDYTGNSNTGQAPDNSVRFEYEGRPDPLLTYQGTAAVRNVVRLSHVRTFAGATPVRDYRVGYVQSPQTARSELRTVTECEATANTCLPATTFDWAAQASGFAGARWATNVGDFSKLSYLPMNATNSGRTDLVGMGPKNPDGTGLAFTVMRSTNAGYVSEPWEIRNAPPGGLSAYSALSWLALDVDGDGATDVVKVGELSGSIGVEFYRSSYFGKGSFDHYSNGSSVSNPLAKAGKFLGGDTDGDRCDDVISVFNDGSGKVAIDVYRLNRSAGYRMELAATTRNGPFKSTGPWDASQRWFVADINNDGRADLIAVRNDAGAATIDVYLSTGSGFTYATWETRAGGFWDTQKWFVGDVNGDGLPDLIDVFDGGGVSNVDVHLNTGRGFQIQRWLTNTGPYWDTQKWFVGDVNGDGRADLVNVYNDQNQATIDVRLSTGSGFDYKQWEVRRGGYWDAQKWALADPKGQGNLQLINLFNDVGRVSVDVHASNPPGDRIIAATTGLGAKYVVNYAALSDTSVYAGGGNSYPKVSITAPLYVVSSVVSPDGTGGTKTTKYWYQSLYSDSAGRGLLGFGFTTATQVESGIETNTYYDNDFPNNNIPSMVTMSRGPGKLLSRVDYTPGCRDPSGAACTVAPGRIYFPYIRKADLKNYDLNGAVLAPTSITETVYDNYGNPTQVTTTATDASGTYSTTTVNTYLNDTSNWFIGRLARSTVTRVSP